MISLPQGAGLCISMLEQAGFKAYAVGGCVRDSLLGKSPADFDLCTSAEPSQICRVFEKMPLVRNGEKHGTIGVCADHALYEITTFRREGGYEDSRHPDWVEFVSSIEEDLSRRDFTVNAMAYHPAEGLIDPFGGQEDLKNGILRAVGEPGRRFQEDALRILRGVRFSVRFGLTPEKSTLEAMLSHCPLMAQLARERIFDELCKLLPLVKKEDLLRYNAVFAQVIPELRPCMGFEQHSPYHLYDVFTHTAQVVEGCPPDLTLRWAALLHDAGKPGTFLMDETGRGHFRGHDALGASLADRALTRLKAPTKLREQVVFLVGHHMVPWEENRVFLRRRLAKWGADSCRQLLLLQQADFLGKGTSASLEETKLPRVQALLEQLLLEQPPLSLRELAVKGADLINAGFPACPGMGKLLDFLLTQVVEEKLPNEKAALLDLASRERNRFFS